MNFCKKLLATVAITILALSPACAWANGPEVGLDAGSMFPVASRGIQLVRESVLVRLPLEGEKPTVECEYVLLNQSNEDRAFTMGFVTSTPNGGYGGYPQVDLYRSSRFRVTQELKELPVTLRPVDQSRWSALIREVPESLFVWDVFIPARESTHLWIYYHAQWAGGSDGVSAGMQFVYHARPAALWDGPIEEASIVFLLGGLQTQLLKCSAANPDGPVVTIAPRGFSWYSSGVKWEMTNWKPVEDFSISIDWKEED